MHPKMHIAASIYCFNISQHQFPNKRLANMQNNQLLVHLAI